MLTHAETIISVIGKEPIQKFLDEIACKKWNDNFVNKETREKRVNDMKILLTYLMYWAFCAHTVQTYAQEPVISSLTRNGTITWTNLVTNSTYRIEWAPKLDTNTSWRSSWTGLERIIVSTQDTTSAEVPMTYRVVLANATSDVQGKWRGILVYTNTLEDATATIYAELYQEGTNVFGLWADGRAMGLVGYIQGTSVHLTRREAGRLGYSEFRYHGIVNGNRIEGNWDSDYDDQGVFSIERF